MQAFKSLVSARSTEHVADALESEAVEAILEERRNLVCIVLGSG